jgi:hypothetical protein
VAYRDRSSGYLKYATNASGSWATVTVDNGGKLGAGAALTLDHNGKVHISYHDYGNEFVKYATNKNGSWDKEEVKREVKRASESYNVSTCIGVDSKGTIYIAYSYYNNGYELYGLSKSPGVLWSVPDRILHNGPYTNLDMKLFNDTPYFIYV